VQWTAARRLLTLGAVAACAVIGVVLAALCNAVERGFGTFVGTAIAPLLWLASTTFIWRETTTERSQRLAGSAHAIVCPACGYNLTGLQTPRCPECGKQYTLDELLAAQPNRGGGEL
jgi:DNA-directed RNA polymerase subunit RPC12/RpoP